MKNIILLCLNFVAWWFCPTFLIKAQNTHSFQYDNLNRLIQVTQVDGSIILYEYDEVGNCIGKSIASGNLLALIIFLEGPFQSSNQNMSRQLLEVDIIPLNQPYNQPPWNYSGTESVINMPTNAVDWVLIELRQASSPELATEATVLPGWPKAMLLMQDGSIKDVAGETPKMGTAVGNNLYIVIHHRNHLSVMSSAPLSLSGNTYSYDFTDAITKAYGGAAGYKQIGSGVYGMVAGDIDADGAVGVTDFNLWALRFGLTNVFNAADADLDGQVGASDFNKWALNFGVQTLLNGIWQNTPFRSQVPVIK